jgi:hypothetical protein
MTQRRTIAGGVLSGLLAGALMILMILFVSDAHGQGFYSPLDQLAGLFWGVNALVGGAGVAIAGLAVHLAFSAFLGAIFAILTEGQNNPGPAFIGGIAYGITVWAVMTFLVQPWANPTMSDRTALFQGWWFIEHLVFGGMLFTTPLFARALERRTEGPRREEPYRQAA